MMSSNPNTPVSSIASGLVADGSAAAAAAVSCGVPYLAECYPRPPDAEHSTLLKGGRGIAELLPTSMNCDHIGSSSPVFVVPVTDAGAARRAPSTPTDAAFANLLQRSQQESTKLQHLVRMRGDSRRDDDDDDDADGTGSTPTVQADRPVPTVAGIYYYEVTLLAKPSSSEGTAAQRSGLRVTIGFVSEAGRGAASSVASPTEAASGGRRKARVPGFDRGSFGFNTEDGTMHSGAPTGDTLVSVPLSEGDVIGCLADFFSNTVSFTLNGRLLQPGAPSVLQDSLAGTYGPYDPPLLVPSAASSVSSLWQQAGQAQYGGNGVPPQPLHGSVRCPNAIPALIPAVGFSGLTRHRASGGSTSLALVNLGAHPFTYDIASHIRFRIAGKILPEIDRVRLGPGLDRPGYASVQLPQSRHDDGAATAAGDSTATSSSVMGAVTEYVVARGYSRTAQALAKSRAAAAAKAQMRKEKKKMDKEKKQGQVIAGEHPSEQQETKNTKKNRDGTSKEEEIGSELEEEDAEDCAGHLQQHQLQDPHAILLGHLRRHVVEDGALGEAADLLCAAYPEYFSFPYGNNNNNNNNRDDSRRDSTAAQSGTGTRTNSSVSGASEAIAAIAACKAAVRGDNQHVATESRSLAQELQFLLDLQRFAEAVAAYRVIFRPSSPSDVIGTMTADQQQRRLWLLREGQRLCEAYLSGMAGGVNCSFTRAPLSECPCCGPASIIAARGSANAEASLKNGRVANNGDNGEGGKRGAGGGASSGRQHTTAGSRDTQPSLHQPSSYTTRRRLLSGLITSVIAPDRAPPVDPGPMSPTCPAVAVTTAAASAQHEQQQATTPAVFSGRQRLFDLASRFVLLQVRRDASPPEAVGTAASSTAAPRKQNPRRGRQQGSRVSESGSQGGQGGNDSDDGEEEDEQQEASTAESGDEEQRGDGEGCHRRSRYPTGLCQLELLLRHAVIASALTRDAQSVAAALF